MQASAVYRCPAHHPMWRASGGSVNGRSCLIDVGPTWQISVLHRAPPCASPCRSSALPLTRHPRLYRRHGLCSLLSKHGSADDARASGSSSSAPLCSSAADRTSDESGRPHRRAVITRAAGSFFEDINPDEPPTKPAPPKPFFDDVRVDDPPSSNSSSSSTASQVRVERTVREVSGPVGGQPPATGAIADSEAVSPSTVDIVTRVTTTVTIEGRATDQPFAGSFGAETAGSTRSGSSSSFAADTAGAESRSDPLAASAARPFDPMTDAYTDSTSIASSTRFAHDDGSAAEACSEPSSSSSAFGARPLDPMTDAYTNSTIGASSARFAAGGEASAGAEAFYEPLSASASGAVEADDHDDADAAAMSYDQRIDESDAGPTDREFELLEEGSGDADVTMAGYESGGEITAEERQRLAAEWGFQQLGELLPEGVRPEAIEERLPPHLLEQDPVLALRSLLLPLAVMAAGYWWIWFSWGVAFWWQAPLTWLAWVAIGTAYTGLFSVAHHCAHYAFLPSQPAVQDVFGAFLMAPSLYAFEPWRVRFFAHLAFCNMMHEDDVSAWHPLTDEKLAEMGHVQRFGAWLMLATPLKLWSSIGHWWSTWDQLDLKASREESRAGMLLSWTAPVACAALLWAALIQAGGLAAWASCWLAPWLVFHAWLSVLSLVQHTAPHIPFRPNGFDYDLGQATISGTVTMQLPLALELLLNNANYHLYEHVSFRVPFYHAREAHEWLRGRLGTYMTEAKMNLTLLRNLVFEWQVYDTSLDTYRRFDDVWDEILSVEEEAAAAATAAGGAQQ